MSTFSTSILPVTVFFLSITAVAFDSSFYEKQVKQQNEGWLILTQAEGDLNGDGFSDVVVALEKKGQKKDADNLIRTLKIYWGDKNGKLDLNLTAPKAISSFNDSSPQSDGPVGFEIDKGVLTLISGGGRGNQGSSIETKWRYQNGSFFLIGFRKDAHNFGAEKGEVLDIAIDANVSTLKMIETIRKVISPSKTDNVEEGKFKKETHSCKVPGSLKKLSLDRFVADDFEESVSSCTNTKI